MDFMLGVLSAVTALQNFVCTDSKTIYRLWMQTLHLFRHTECFDPREKASPLCLAEEVTNRRIMPEYRFFNTVADVYIDVGKFSLTQPGKGF